MQKHKQSMLLHLLGALFIINPSLQGGCLGLYVLLPLRGVLL